MGMTYDVTYPNTRELDADVSQGYLNQLAKRRRNIGARARNTNWDGHTLVLVDEGGKLVWAQAPPSSAPAK